MPAYPWLAEDDLDISTTAAKINALRKLGTPYDAGYEEIANDDLGKQAAAIAKRLKEEGVEQAGVEKKEIVALIAYLQRLGVDITLEANAGK